MPERIRLRQHGRMWNTPGGRGMRFEAVEEFQVRVIGFSWRARIRIGPLAWILVEDAYRDGEGWLEGRLWGRKRFFRHAGEAFNDSERLRYLAEVFWVPFAIEHNAELVWERRTENAVTVAAAAAPDHPVELQFDGAGDISRILATRGRLEGEHSVQRPWRGTLGPYVTTSGIRFPSDAEVAWQLSDGTWFTYWSGEVSDLHPA